MPVVLVEVGGVARSGHEYDDRTGVAYEYPTRRYQRLIVTGERFMYQVPGAGYVGCGIVGDQRPSAERGRTVCDVLSVEMFDEPVGLKNLDGQYYEADPTYWKEKVYWGQGVRPLSDERFNAILTAARVHESRLPASTRDVPRVGHGYARTAVAGAIEEYSVAVAYAAMSAKYGAAVTIMPRNNPGFDLLVGTSSAPVRYVEVKGTQAAAPVFFLSEGERKFSFRNSQRYTLFVVSGIDLQSDSHATETIHDGALAPEAVDLSPTQWRGNLRISSRA